MDSNVFVLSVAMDASLTILDVHVCIYGTKIELFVLFDQTEYQSDELWCKS